MATLEQLLQAAQDESTAEDSIIALLGSVKSQLDKVLAGQLQPAQQQQVDAIFSTLGKNKAKVLDAVTANTDLGGDAGGTGTGGGDDTGAGTTGTTGGGTDTGTTGGTTGTTGTDNTGGTPGAGDNT